MDMISLSSSAHYSHHYSSVSFFARKTHPATTYTPRFSLSFSQHAESDPPTTSSSPCPSLSGEIRRPKTCKSNPSGPSTSPPPKTSSNPLKTLLNPPITPTNPHKLTDKLWLTSKISPPPPPPPPPPPLPPTANGVEENQNEDLVGGSISGDGPEAEFRQEGKIFVGNLPSWIKKPEVAEFFRQFGPIKNVILIKGREDMERNMGYGFVIYGGPTAGTSAMKAVEFDGVEFHGRVLTVKLDNGRRMKLQKEERKRWVEGWDGREYRTKWHEEREDTRREFRKVLEATPENWQAVVRAFEGIKKVELLQLHGVLALS